MNLREEIKANPYLNPANCMDIADVNAGIDAVESLIKRFGERNELVKLCARLWNKRKTLSK